MDLLSPPESKHLLYCPFTGLGKHNGYRGDTWLKNRVKIFKNFVLPSLLNQSCQNFVLWISWRQEEVNNPIVDEFGQSLSQIRGLKFLFTYGGLCFWDDKYPDEVAEARLKTALSATLPHLHDVIGQAQNVLMTIQPSDDMYVYDAVETIQKKDFVLKTRGYLQGYIMDYSTGEIAEYNPDTIPPFFTIKFPTDIFLDPAKHMEYSGPYKSHEHVPEFVTIKGRGFCVGTHGQNISTTFNHPYKGKILQGGEKEKVLMSLGLYFQDPVKVAKRFGVLLKKIFNYLPGNRIIYDFYKSKKRVF